MKRFMAIINGDFTPLHEAEVSFTTLLLADGRRIDLRTHESMGLNTLFVPERLRNRRSKARKKLRTRTGA